MKYNVIFSEIVAQLVKVYNSEEMTLDYNMKGEMFDAICGWCGVMAPISREAFIKAFGASVVIKAENKAREEIQAAQERHNAPADGLQLVEIAGGVAVVGDSRTTYRNRKEIKAHGAKWNKNAQRWEGTEPEAVAALRAWFGASDDEQTTNKTGEPSEGKQKPENVTRSQLLQVVAVARWFGSVEWSTAGMLRDRDTIETDGNDPEAVTLWHRFGRPLNRRACVEIFGEDVTAEGERLHTKADHSAHYTEDGDTFAEWWQAVAEISDQERAPRTA